MTATFVIGPLDTIEEVNDAACDLVGYSRAQLVGLHGSELVPSERHAATAVSLDRIRLGAITFREGYLKHKNGTLIPVDVEARRVAGDRLALDVRKRIAR